eukprot:Skav221949  [mRNA]  locus=scaffold195:529150:532846:- [translate_table: standard]
MRDSQLSTSDFRAFRQALAAAHGTVQDGKEADVMVGAHGAGLAWMVAMDPGSAVAELMPERLPGYVACVEGWDHPRNLRHSALAQADNEGGQLPRAFLRGSTRPGGQKDPRSRDEVPQGEALGQVMGAVSTRAKKDSNRDPFQQQPTGNINRW